MTDTSIIASICCFFYLLVPTSFQGHLFGGWYEAFKWGVAFVVICWLGARNKINKSRLFLAGIAFIYLFIISFWAVVQFDARFSLARVAPIVCLLLLFSIKIEHTVSEPFARRMTRLILVYAIAMGIGMITHYEPIGRFLINFYSQSYDECVPNAVNRGRPVFTLGVYTRTAFFYLLFFYYYYVKTKKTKKYRYIIGGGICLFLCVCLVSNSSLVYSAVMVLLIVWLLKDKILVLVGIGISAHVALLPYYEYFFAMYKRAMASNLNGIGARYGNGFLLYQDNIKIIKESLGLGFTIVEGVIYADSGWLQFLTMGSVPLLLIMYYLLYKSVKDNFENYLMIFFIIMSFEFVECGLWLGSFVFLYILFIMIMKSCDGCSLIK